MLGVRRRAVARRLRQGATNPPRPAAKAEEAAGDETLAAGLDQNAKLAAAVKAAGLDADARRAGPLYRAGPDDAAFGKLPPGALDS